MRRKSVKRLAVSAIVVLALLAGCSGAPSQGATGVTSCTGGSVAGLNAEQAANARAIAKVTLGLGLGTQGVLLAILTANVETDLRNMPDGDRDSVGLFQQRGPWGSFEERHNPVTATTMFFKGGRTGQPGVLSFAGWQTRDVGLVMQQTQQSQYSQQPGDQSPGYPGKLAAAEAATKAITAGCTTVAGGDSLAGSGVGARIVAVAKTQLGVRYSWGGGSLTGPTMGIRDGGTADSYGDYAAVGWDCSGLVKYAVYKATGVIIPRTAAEQRAAGAAVPADLAKLQAGDLIIFGTEHVGIYVGDGLMLNAPNSGAKVRYDSVAPGSFHGDTSTWTVRRIGAGGAVA